MSLLQFVVVTGLSGAGKSQAMKSFEDLGFHCVDNVPPAIVGSFVELCDRANLQRVALALDARSHGPLGEAADALRALDERGVTYDLLFLDATDDALVRRYSETRRRHRVAWGGARGDAPAAARRAVSDLRARASRVWDTSGMTQAMLKGRIAAVYADGSSLLRLDVELIAFGFKFGLPLEADLVFDVRFFPNPNYDPNLRDLSGADEAVVRFMEALPITAPFFEQLYALIDFLMPLYLAEGKSRLTIAVGCTGGRHRSIYVVDQIAEHLRGTPGIAVSVTRRDLVHA
jgi:UPF0042 nucleotide-binding protein